MMVKGSGHLQDAPHDMSDMESMFSRWIIVLEPQSILGFAR